MRCPAPGIDIWKSAATSGSRPIMRNSVVPMPNAPIASASRAKGKGSALRLFDAVPVRRRVGVAHRRDRLCGVRPEVLFVDDSVGTSDEGQDAGHPVLGRIGRDPVACQPAEVIALDLSVWLCHCL